jgi:hypothetical protein
MDSGYNVVYNFADGTKQICAIGQKSLFDAKGRRKTKGELESMFATTAHDIGAISFEL